MAVSTAKARKSRSTGAGQPGSGKRVKPQATSGRAGSRSSKHAVVAKVKDAVVAASPRIAGRNRSQGPITYAPEKGVISFANRVARATPMEAVEVERAGVSGRYVKDLARHLGLATTRVFGIIDVPRATAEKKAARDEFVTGHSGQAALALTKLLALANEIAAESTDPNARDFDAAKWLGAWIERPQPALGGRKPADLVDTPAGAQVVMRLLGSVASGAYQ